MAACCVCGAATLGSLPRERDARCFVLFGFGDEGGSGGKYHCSFSPEDTDPFLSGDTYPGEIAVPVYRAGEAGSLDRNFGRRSDVEGESNLSLTLSRREVCFGR